MNLQSSELKTEKYTIQVNYSEEAIEKKMMKFITPNGDEFEISSEEMISFLVNQVNMKTLEPTFVDTEKINICEVMRQLSVVANRDIKKGEEIRIDYKHPYPLEFALLEEIYNIAKVQEGTKIVELTKEIIEDTKSKLTPRMEDFSKKFHQTFKQVGLGVEPKK